MVLDKCHPPLPPPQVLGAVGALPAIFTELEISYFLLRRLLGVRTEGDKRGAKVRGGTSEEQRCVGGRDKRGANMRGRDK